jgi:hypothetical protein
LDTEDLRRIRLLINDHVISNPRFWGLLTPREGGGPGGTPPMGGSKNSIKYITKRLTTRFKRV